MKAKELSCPKCKNKFITDYSDKMPQPYSAKCTNCGFRFKFYLTGGVLEEKKEEFKEIKPKIVKEIIKIEEKIIAPIKTEMKRIEEEFRIEEEIVEKKVIERTTIAGALLVIVFILGIATSILISTYSITIFQIEKREATVYGSVIDEFGNPINDVNITISGTNYSTYTNTQGLYFIYGVEEGNYDIVASKDGFITIIKKVTLKGGDNHISFELEKGNENKISDERTGISTIDSLKTVNTIGLTLIILFSIVALIAGIFSFQKKKFWICLIGSALSIPSSGLILVGPILSVIAFFLILFSKREFRT